MQIEMFKDLLDTTLDPNGKTCVYCNKTKSLKSYPKHIGHKDNLDTRCKTCIKKQSQIRNRLRKTAPPQPNLCECCNKVPKKHFVLDHVHDTEEFRGWLCDHCNLAIGLLGDSIEGVQQAIEYLNDR
jgi:hypothetical protein|tara:strand:+ start:43 stop:423 length:381 start_codon:yes stop_codon:yes gene_type:complete